MSTLYAGCQAAIVGSMFFDHLLRGHLRTTGLTSIVHVEDPQLVLDHFMRENTHLVCIDGTGLGQGGVELANTIRERDVLRHMRIIYVYEEETEVMAKLPHYNVLRLEQAAISQETVRRAVHQLIPML